MSINRGGTNVPVRWQDLGKNGIIARKHFSHKPYACDFKHLKIQEDEIENEK